MTLDSQPLKRLQDLEDQLSSLQQERDQLKQRIGANQSYSKCSAAAREDQ